MKQIARNKSVIQCRRSEIEIDCLGSSDNRSGPTSSLWSLFRALFPPQRTTAHFFQYESYWRTQFRDSIEKCAVVRCGVECRRFGFVRSRRRARSCGARTRGGNACRAPAVPNGRRRGHGGPSPGAPKGNKNALKHGLYTGEAIAQRREMSAWMRAMRALARNGIINSGKDGSDSGNDSEGGQDGSPTLD